MLTENQARQIVHSSINKTTKRSVASNNETLQQLDISSAESVRSLAMTIAADPEVGVPSLQHYIDPNSIADLQAEMTVGQLSELVLDLSAGKLCSNPNTPHPQKCCPYPAKCPQCGYPVK